MLTSQCNFIMEQAGADISPPALHSWKPSTMQDPPRRLSAVPFLSSFFEGRRHSASDPILRLQQGRRSSAAKVLSSSSLQVMVAMSSVSCAERNPTCPERKSKAPFLLKDWHTFEFKYNDCEEAMLCLYLLKFWEFYIILFIVCYAKRFSRHVIDKNAWMFYVFFIKNVVLV